MTRVEKEPETPLPLGQFVKMTAPVFIFGVILPIVDIFTDLRMIIRLYVGVPGCKHYSRPRHNPCLEAEDFNTYCQDNPGGCSTEQHSIFASILLGKFFFFGKLMNIWS